MTRVLYCVNGGCEYNARSRCALHRIVVDKKGQCMIATNRTSQKIIPARYSTRADIAKELKIQTQLVSYYMISLGIKHDVKIKTSYCYSKDRVPGIVKQIKTHLRKTPSKYASDEDRRG